MNITKYDEKKYVSFFDKNDKENRQSKKQRERERKRKEKKKKLKTILICKYFL